MVRAERDCFTLSAEAWLFIRSHGFFGMIIPKAFGGLELSHAAHSAVVMKLATRSVTAAVTVMVPNSLGPGKLLLRYGTEAQKKHYLPRLARGAEIPCFGLTAPRAGSDAGSIPDTGVVCRGTWQGRHVLGLRLNWDKRYITLGPVATVIGLAFRCLDPDRLLGGRADRGITVALVPRETPGVGEALARIAGLAYQMDAARLLTLSALEQGERPAGLDPGSAASTRDAQALRRNPAVEEQALRQLQTRLARFPGYVRLRRIALMDEPWTVENGLLTPTLKLRRNEVLARFSERVEALYDGRW